VRSPVGVIISLGFDPTMRTALLTARWTFAIYCLSSCSDVPQPELQVRTPRPDVQAPCSPEQSAASVTNLNFLDQSCSTATALAESQLSSLHYRRACQSLDQETALPTAVSRAGVTNCLATEGRGVFLDLEVCCPAPLEIAREAPVVVRSSAPRCPLWRTSAVARNLHYPQAENCNAIRADAEAALGSAHYRKACEAAVPRSTRVPNVIKAQIVECRSGTGDPGVYVDVGLCCEAKVFAEQELRELVWQRSQADVRGSLGNPHVVTEDSAGIHWRYGFEVARAEKVFPAVTLVFSDDVVNSYYFELVNDSTDVQ
jgi:hypothetical protein